MNKEQILNDLKRMAVREVDPYEGIFDLAAKISEQGLEPEVQQLLPGEQKSTDNISLITLFTALRCLENNKKIHAIKLIRTESGMGLKEAKYFVEEELKPLLIRKMDSHYMNVCKTIVSLY